MSALIFHRLSFPTAVAVAPRGRDKPTCSGAAEFCQRHLTNEVLSISGDSVAICFHYFDKPF